MDAEAIREVFRGLGSIQIRRMFGGQGIYRGGAMFALEADGELYLKTDAEIVAVFRDLGSRPFVYEGRQGRKTTMSYWLMPEAALDDPEEAARLASLALDAACRAKAAKPLKNKTAPR
jgi:DNA transformation protein